MTYVAASASIIVHCSKARRHEPNVGIRCPAKECVPVHSRARMLGCPPHHALQDGAPLDNRSRRQRLARVHTEAMCFRIADDECRVGEVLHIYSLRIKHLHQTSSTTTRAGYERISSTTTLLGLDSPWPHSASKTLLCRQNTSSSACVPAPKPAGSLSENRTVSVDAYS